MATIHPLGLALLVATQKNVQLIDVRRRAQFNRSHIRGARSVPLRELQAMKMVQARPLTNGEALVVISDTRIRATLAAGVLRTAACLKPIVLEGGMEAWEAEGLPTERSWRFRLVSAMDERLQRIMRRRPAANGEINQSGIVPRSADNDRWEYELQPRQASRG